MERNEDTGQQYRCGGSGFPDRGACQRERERFAGERHLVDGEEKTVSEMTARELKAAIEEREQARRARYRGRER